VSDLIPPKHSTTTAEGKQRPELRLFRFRDVFPVQWHENKIGATHRPWWFYNVSDISDWFNIFCISCLQPGQSEGFHSHLPEHEGPYECWYLVFDGEGQVRTEFADHNVEKFDAVFIPPNASHQMRNNSTQPLWYATLSSRGGHPLKVDVYALECSEARPGYMEEYERIMEVRRQNGLPVP
jgi:oxalate decarboxylase/phosphoglucose isomerase-like protein (cupin superfamily)